MAVLTADELAIVRRKVAPVVAAINYTKPQINLAIQAIEDWWEANKVEASQAVDTATSPFTFTVAQKKKIFAYWLELKFGKEAA